MVNSSQNRPKNVSQTYNESGGGVPAFLAKLWRLVEDPETNNLICWSKDGRSFIIQNQAKFARELLPLNYKHNNMASFIRQLNMYGFHKITSIDNGGLKFDRDEMEFTHPCFKRNCAFLLEHIKRKIATNKIVDDKTALKTETVSKVLQDVKAMRGRQDSLDTRFSLMKEENEALWREIASLRQKHVKQQQIVNKLIQFLITIVQPQRNVTSVQRHIQLMINDTPDNLDKVSRTSESEEKCGPIIHELSEELLDEAADTESELSPLNKECQNVDVATSPMQMERPQSSGSMVSQNYDVSSDSTDNTTNDQNTNTSDITAAVDNSKKAIIQAVDIDGAQFYYHVTEVNDAQPNDMNITDYNYNDDNVLTTPMVRRETARRHMLKEKNKERSIKNAENSSETIHERKMARLINDHNIELNEEENNSSSTISSIPLQVKSEQDLNPIVLLNVYGDDEDNCSFSRTSAAPISATATSTTTAINTDTAAAAAATSTSISTSCTNLMSENLSEGSHQPIHHTTDQILSNTGLTDNSVTMNEEHDSNTTTSDLMMYNSNNFINNDMPTDLFEDTSLMSSGDSSNISCENLKLGQQQHQGKNPQRNKEILDFKCVNNENTTSMYLRDNEILNQDSKCLKKDMNMASTLAAAAEAVNINDNMSTNNKETDSVSTMGSHKQLDIVPTTSKIADVNNEDNNNIALMKYQPNDDIMRLSTADDFHNHLDTIQDELETLKDILRSDTYSLDHNTLSGLFNDSEILDPYGLTYADYADIPDKKVDPNLLSCQPIYDLTDIINDQNYLDDNEIDGNIHSEYQQNEENSKVSNSVLNTPRHE